VPEPPTSQRLRIAPRPTAPRSARDFLAATCASWDAEEFIEPGALVLSELVTNAVQHAGTAVDVELRLADGWLEMCVYDEGLGVPEMIPPRQRAVGGHGLEIVSRVAHAWGVSTNVRGGKAVWCVLKAE
jgi:anti-sigma regulatory factor (Ser/Thr protein kinase)